MTHLGQSNSLVYLPCRDFQCAPLFFNAFLHSQSTRLVFSFSPPRIWLSRSTSETDALGDDETPLRLTALKTATTRGVMVFGIMDALDIAPTLHFVEPGLKVNGEVWIKVMDENLTPNCNALMELEHKFFLLIDNAPSHACRLVCEHYKTVVQCRVSTAVFPRSFSLALVSVERAGDTARSVSNSCQSSRIEGTTDLRAS